MYCFYALDRRRRRVRVRASAAIRFSANHPCLSEVRTESGGDPFFDPTDSEGSYEHDKRVRLRTFSTVRSASPCLQRSDVTLCVYDFFFISVQSSSGKLLSLSKV